MKVRSSQSGDRSPDIIDVLVVSLAVSTLLAKASPSTPALLQQALAPPPLADLWLVLYLVAKAGRVPRVNRPPKSVSR